jgi:predicted nuclease of predicted toxin-antitoxin system
VIVADESIDRAIVEGLRSMGIEVQFILEVARGDSDEQVLRRAQSHRALLLTADKDFGELVYHRGHSHFGVVLLRLAGLTQKEKTDIVVSAFRVHEAAFADSFSVITQDSIRIRPKA